ncbi:MAG: 5'-methylthioadenosine/S-adenosylhomocysteine nucleosidase [Legionellales bacterium]|nr:5'-methylthioadenosine/S-adenosylhomocysteine nucleosidase [Legionellales bacterium]|tara:strand:+ start:585 stop:1394 length:810 start_codon:yes stop_codon:yes gene_type:complete
MTIGIIGAMREEVDSIRSDLMQNVCETVIGGRTYYEGSIHDTPVVLVFSHWGKVASATSTTTLINSFNAKEVIFTGVAGATSSELNIGDIVISSKCYQHDMDASPLFNKHEIPLIGETFFSAHEELILQSKQSCSAMVLNFSNFFDNDQLMNDFAISSPKVYLGVIASGDQFINSDEKINALLKDVPETLAVEMEGASVAHVCHEHNIPFVIIRTISDRADSKAAIDFPRFVSTVANIYSKNIINGILGQRKVAQQENRSSYENCYPIE